MIWLIAYLVGYVWFYRYAVGFVLYPLGYSYQPDAEDIFFSSILGALLNILWPVTVPGHFICRTVAGRTDSERVASLFPKPKPIETKAERERRQLNEQKRAVQEKQNFINQVELDAGMTPTVWN